METRTFTHGHILVQQDKIPDFFVIITKGIVRQSVKLRDEKVVVLSDLGRGTFYDVSEICGITGNNKNGTGGGRNRQFPGVPSNFTLSAQSARVEVLLLRREHWTRMIERCSGTRTILQMRDMCRQQIEVANKRIASAKNLANMYPAMRKGGGIKSSPLAQRPEQLQYLLTRMATKNLVDSVDSTTEKMVKDRRGMSANELRRAVRESSIRFHNTQMSCMKHTTELKSLLLPLRQPERVYKRQVMRPFDKQRATYLKEKRRRNIT